MGRAMGKWTARLLIVAATSWATAIRAAESPQEEVLRKNGLKTLGPIYVLEAESDVKKKVRSSSCRNNGIMPGSSSSRSSAPRITRQ